MLYRVVYLSFIAPEAEKSVAEIVGHARLNNERLAVTGILVFDGLRLCQHLEGPTEVVLLLMERIRVDPRHIQPEVKEHGPVRFARRFGDWPMAYARCRGTDDLNELQHCDPTQSAFGLLELLLPRLDLYPTTFPD